MKPKQLAMAIALLASLGIPGVLTAQDPPAKTYQPGYWQPEARFNLDRPVAVKIVNRAGLPLRYEFSTDQSSIRQLSPGETAQFRNSPVPAYVLIYPTNSLASVQYEVEVAESDNVVTVNVSRSGNNTPGDTTLNLHETGAIYIY